MVTIRYLACGFQGVYRQGKLFYYRKHGNAVEDPRTFTAATVKELRQMLRANQIPLIKRKMMPRAKAKSQGSSAKAKKPKTKAKSKALVKGRPKAKAKNQGAKSQGARTPGSKSQGQEPGAAEASARPKRKAKAKPKAHAKASAKPQARAEVKAAATANRQAEPALAALQPVAKALVRPGAAGEAEAADQAEAAGEAEAVGKAEAAGEAQEGNGELSNFRKFAHLMEANKRLSTTEWWGFCLDQFSMRVALESGLEPARIHQVLHNSFVVIRSKGRAETLAQVLPKYMGWLGDQPVTVLVELCEFQAYAGALSSFLVEQKVSLRVGRAGPQHQVQAALEMIPMGMMAVFLDDNVQSFLAGQRRCAAGDLGRLISQARLRVLGNCLLCLMGRRLQCFPLV